MSFLFPDSSLRNLCPTYANSSFFRRFLFSWSLLFARFSGFLLRLLLGLGKGHCSQTGVNRCWTLKAKAMLIATSCPLLSPARLLFSSYRCSVQSPGLWCERSTLTPSSSWRGGPGRACSTASFLRPAQSWTMRAALLGARCAGNCCHSRTHGIHGCLFQAKAERDHNALTLWL